MATKKINFGKYKGAEYKNVPVEYIEWMWKNNFSVNLVNELRLITRFHNHGDLTTRKPYTNPNGTFAWVYGKHEGLFIMYIDTYKKKFRQYFLADKDGNHVRDLMSIDSTWGRQAKQGAVDVTLNDWVTLSPNGNKTIGKMIVSPYYEHFGWETYQVKVKA